MLPQVIVPKVFSLVAAPHGILDVYHSIDNDKKSEYIVANIIGTALAASLWDINHDAVMATFMIMSAFHWRHQFDIVPDNWSSKESTLKGLPIILSSAFVSLSNQEPLLIYMFLTFIHTPHQYYHNRDLLESPSRVWGIVGLTYCVTLVLPYVDKFYESPFAIGCILGHIIYQEFSMVNATDLVL